MAYRPENPVGSTSAKDLMANAENFDLLALGENSSYPDRKGATRKSWKGMEREFISGQTSRDVQFAGFLDSSGYEAPVAYVSGLYLERPTQTVTYLGNEYRVKSQFIPLATTDWSTDASKLKLIGDDSLRQDMANAVDPEKGGGLVRVSQEAPSSRARSLLDVYKDIVRVEDFVEFGDGRDEGEQLQNAFDFAFSQGKTLVGRFGWTVGSSRQISINCRSSYEGNGMNIIPLGLTSGTFIKISGTTVGVGDIHGLRSKVKPGSAGGLTGVQIGDTSGQTSGLDFIKWDIYGFDINLKFFGVNVFILNFLGCSIGGATRRNISYECTRNSGENIRFSGGTISDAHNQENTAVALFIPPNVSAPDIRIDKLSMSYNDSNGDIATGIVEVTGVHEENRNTREFWRIRNTVGVEKTIFTKIAGTLAPGPLSDGKEPAQGRDAFIVYDGSTSVIVRDVKLGDFRPATGTNPVADYVTKVAKHSGVGGAALRLRINGSVDANRGTGIPLDLSPETDHAYLTGAGSFDGFTQNTASGISFSSGTDGNGADTRSRSIIGSGAGSGSYNLQLPILPGQTVIAKVSCKTVGASSCAYAGARLIYRTANNVQISIADFGRVITTPNNAAYVVQFALDMAPAGAAYVVMQMRAAGLTGEARFSNERIWILD